MSIPEGYEKLAVVGIAYKGEYDANTSYKTMNAVYHEGSTYVALRDNPVGTPSNDSADWMYLAKGFTAHLLSEINATDTSGLLGEAGASVGAQALIDTIADKVATKLLLKSDVVSQIIDDATKAASMAALYDVNQRVDELNSNFGLENRAIRFVAGSDNSKSLTYCRTYDSPTKYRQLVANDNSLIYETQDGDNRIKHWEVVMKTDFTGCIIKTIYSNKGTIAFELPIPKNRITGYIIVGRDTCGFIFKTDGTIDGVTDGYSASYTNGTVEIHGPVEWYTLGLLFLSK